MAIRAVNHNPLTMNVGIDKMKISLENGVNLNLEKKGQRWTLVKSQKVIVRDYQINVG